ncbi:hypothetical protein [Paenibacillus gorillae]|uniref:hypothetical protein n=1 Tax=Paenibacillus gorillae TaxID=1243662 RepID=UPI0004BA5CC1|nr:hypothetical protein [Paenibacillus gorillae]
MKKYTMFALVAIVCLTSVSLVMAGSREYAPVVQTPSMETGYVERLVHSDKGYSLDFDSIEWYEGDAATAKFREREGDSGLDAPPDGYYIVNDDPSVKTLPIADDAVVLMQIYDRDGHAANADIQWDEQISLAAFAEHFSKDESIKLKDFPYHITVKDGKVVRIVQQYIP